MELVASVNRAFLPDAVTIDWAARVIAAAKSGNGAVSVDGAMVDRPVVERARLILAKAESRPG